MGIPFGSSFDLAAAVPLDGRIRKDDITARNGIDVNFRFQGLSCFVQSTQKNYQLRGGTTDPYWVNMDDLADDIFAFDTANRKYTPYTDANKGAGRFYNWSATYPTNSYALAFDGHFYATTLRAGGSTDYTQIVGSTIQSIASSTARLSMVPSIADTGANIAYTLDTTNTLTSGRKLLSLRNQGTEKFYIDYAGNAYANGILLGAGVALSSITDPSADKTFTMSSYKLGFTWNTTTIPANSLMSLEYTGAPSSYGDILSIRQTTAIPASTVRCLYIESGSSTYVYPLWSKSQSDRPAIYAENTNNGDGIYSKVTNASNWAFNGFSILGGGIIAYSENNIAAKFFKSNNSIAANDSTNVLEIMRLSETTTYTTSGSLIYIRDEPSVPANASGSIFKAMVDSTIRIDMNPRTANTGTNVAYYLDTVNNLTSGRKLFSIRNQGTEKFYIDYNGNAYANGTLLAGGGITLSNGVDNRLVTATGASGLNGESALTFNGTYLEITRTGGNPSLKGVSDLVFDTTSGSIYISNYSSPTVYMTWGGGTMYVGGNTSNYWSVAGTISTIGTVYAPDVNSRRIALERNTGTGGISFYSIATYTAWQIYMGNPGNGATEGVRGNMTPSTGTYVTSWGMRFVMEDAAGYGWVFEKGTTNTTAPSRVLEISKDGVMYAYEYRGWGAQGGTGQAAQFPAGMYVSGGTTWNYTTTYRSGAYTYGQGDIVFNDYGLGLVGVYTSDRYQAVFSMGASYVPLANGTGLSNSYGIIWTHSNVGGQSKAGLGHQMLITEAGATRSAIGYGIWTVGNVTLYSSYSAIHDQYNSTLNSDSRNSRGVTRLFRRDDDSDYSMQASWETNVAGYWSIRGYNGDSYHAECWVGRAGYADTAGSAPANGGTSAACSGDAHSVDGQHFAWSNSSNSPSYLWAADSNGSAYLCARGSMSVNYATSAGSAPASDVYGWAKAASKPSYDITEITNGQTGNGYMASGTTDITCPASEAAMSNMSISFTAKTDKLFAIFTAPFYTSAANQSLYIIINIDGSNYSTNRHYITSGWQLLTQHCLIAVTIGTTYTVTARWVGSTSISQRGSTDSARRLTVFSVH